MAEGFDLPRVKYLEDVIITKSGIDKMTEEDLIKNVATHKTKAMVTDGKISLVLVSPDLYNTFVEAVDALKASRAGN